MKTQHKNRAFVTILTMLFLMLSLESKAQLTGTYRICKGTTWRANAHIYEDFNFMMEHYALNISCDCWYLKGVNQYYHKGFYKFRTNGSIFTFQYLGNNQWRQNNQPVQNPFISGY